MVICAGLSAIITETSRLLQVAFTVGTRVDAPLHVPYVVVIVAGIAGQVRRGRVTHNASSGACHVTRDDVIARYDVARVFSEPVDANINVRCN